MRHRPLALVVLISATLGSLTLAACRPAASQAPPNVLVLEDVTVIDGTGAAPRPHRTVVVRAGRIAAEFAAGSEPLPAGALRPDVRGHTVIPGLIDAHVHLASFEREDGMAEALLRYAFLGGVTSVRDMGGSPAHVARLAAAARAPGAALPRVFGSAVVSGPRWFVTYRPERVRFWSDGYAIGTTPGVRRVTDTTDAARAVTGAAALGVRDLKLYDDLPPALVAGLAAAAHAAGLRVWAHAVVPPSRPSDLVAAGVDVLTHADQLAFEAAGPADTLGSRALRARLMLTPPAATPALGRLFAAMRARGTLLEPTLFVMTPREGPPGPIPAWAAAATREAHRQGVGIVAGTDALGDEAPNLHAELALLVERAGLTPLEAIRSATQHGARALGVEDSLGTVAVGKVADLVVLRRNPAEHIAHTTTVAHVVRGGVLHRRTAPWPASER